MKYLLLFSIYQFLAELQICIIYTCQHRYTDWSWQIIKWKQKIPFVGTTVPKYNHKRGKINTHFYMATHFPGLVHTYIWPLTFLAWYWHLYMATHFPGLVLTLIYGHSLSWLGTHLYMATPFPGLVHTYIWPLPFLAWYTLIYGHSLFWLGTDTSIWPLTFLAWYWHFYKEVLGKTSLRCPNLP
jgi:hypothetical protein